MSNRTFRIAALAAAALCAAAQAEVVEEQFDLPARVSDAYGKRIERAIKGGFARMGFVVALPTHIGYGVSGGDPKNSPQRPCSPRMVEQAYAQFGSNARVPMPWVYTENDQYWGATHPREWFEAFRGAGGRAEFVQVAPHGNDGHRLFARFPGVWKPIVAEFLRKQGFEMKEVR